MTKHALTALFVGFGLSVGLACGDAVQSMILPDAAAQGDAGVTEPMVFEVECDQIDDVELTASDVRRTWFGEVAADGVTTASKVDAISCSWNRSEFYPVNAGVSQGECSRLNPERVSYGQGIVRVICGIATIREGFGHEVPEFGAATVSVH